MVRSLARLQFFQNSNHVRLFQLMIADNDSPIVYTKYTNKKNARKNFNFKHFLKKFFIYLEILIFHFSSEIPENRQKNIV